MQLQSEVLQQVLQNSFTQQYHVMTSLHTLLLRASTRENVLEDDYENVWNAAFRQGLAIPQDDTLPPAASCKKCLRNTCDIQSLFSIISDSSENEVHIQKIHADPLLRNFFGKRYMASSLCKGSRAPFNVNTTGGGPMYIDGGLFENNTPDMSFCDAIFEFKLLRNSNNLREDTREGRRNLGQAYTYALKLLELRPVLESVRVLLYSMDDGRYVRMTVSRDTKVVFTSPHLASVSCHELIDFISSKPIKRVIPDTLRVLSYLGSGASATAYRLADNLVFKSYHHHIELYIKQEELEILTILTYKAVREIPTVQLVQSYLPLGISIKPVFQRADWSSISPSQMSNLIETFRWLHNNCKYTYQEIHEENIMISVSGALALCV